MKTKRNHIEVQPGILVQLGERVGDWLMTKDGWSYQGQIVPQPELPSDLCQRALSLELYRDGTTMALRHGGARS
jgi:hypothetical protein